MSADNQTNKLIQDTFQNVVQASPSPSGSALVKLYDLTGNEITDLDVSGSISVDGTDMKCFTIAMAIALG